MTSSGTVPTQQPQFDSRITTLAFPVNGGKFGPIQRGFMVWEQPIGGYSDSAMVSFLYNPSTVSASYYMSNSSVSSSYLFPTGFNSSNLTVPLNQSVEFSLLFDRTYELWQQYDSIGLPLQSGVNNPAVSGVLVDIQAMEQFTGMNVAYSDGNTTTTSPTSGSLVGHQGIMQLIPSYVYFGGNSAALSLWYYGYISEWDVTVTHWTQYMVPMRCVINVTFTMLPPPTSASATSSTRQLPSGTGPGVSNKVGNGLPGTSTLPTTGVSGR